MQIKSSLCNFISTLGPIGYIPYAPGTFGSAVTIVFIYLLPNVNPIAYIIFLTILSIFALLCSHMTAKEMRIKDPSQIVIDEVIGMSISLFMIPKTLTSYLMAFLIFRFLDITKPYPINKSQDFYGGFGIIMDDVFAGLITLIVMQILQRVF